MGSRLQGHPDMAKTPGVEMTAGSLGHGLAAGQGMALAGKLDRLDYRVFVLLGDGESQEGLIWETALSAPNFKVDNLVAILDRNGHQSGGAVDDIMPLGDMAEKWRAMGWDLWEIDGHDIPSLYEAFSSAPRRPGAVVTVEENNIYGGLGGAVAEECPTPMVRVGIQDCYADTGSHDDLLARFGLTVENIVDGARRAMSRKG